MPLLTPSVNGFWKRVQHSHGQTLCIAALHQARTPHFYEIWALPDTLEGRFDCAVLHVFLILRHLKRPLAQAVFDAFFSYTELTLREIGVSDLKIGKQVKNCAKYFYGAIKAYEKSLEGRDNLEEALTRNLYGNIYSPWVKEFSTYVRLCNEMLKEQNLANARPPSINWPRVAQYMLLNNP